MQPDAPCFDGTRVPLQTFIDYLVNDLTVEEFLLDFPAVSREAVHAVLQSLVAPRVPQG